MRSQEQLEWERMSKRHASANRGQMVRLVIAIAVAVGLAVGAFFGAMALWDGQMSAREQLRKEGYVALDQSKQDASDAKSFPVLFLVLPALVGTAAFAITFRAIGGKMPDAYKRVLGG